MEPLRRIEYPLTLDNEGEKKAEEVRRRVELAVDLEAANWNCKWFLSREKMLTNLHCGNVVQSASEHVLPTLQRHKQTDRQAGRQGWWWAQLCVAGKTLNTGRDDSSPFLAFPLAGLTLPVQLPVMRQHLCVNQPNRQSKMQAARFGFFGFSSAGQ
jgi:hypothetical protein